MPRISRKSSKSISKKQPIYLEAPPELWKVIIDDCLKSQESSRLEEIRESSARNPKAVLITRMHHAPSRHVVHLNFNQDSRDRPSQVLPKRQTVTKIRQASIVHAWRLGAQVEPKWLAVFNELAFVNLVRLLFRVFQFFGPIAAVPKVLITTLDWLATKIAWFRISRAGSEVLNLKIQISKLQIRMPVSLAFLHKKSRYHARDARFVFPLHWQRAIASFVAVSIIFVLPLKALSFYADLQSTRDDILTLGQDGVLQILQGLRSAKNSPDQAVSYFAEATLSFREARDEIGKINSLILNLSKLHPKTNKEIGNGKLLIEIAEDLARMAEVFTSSSDVFGSQDDLINKISDFRTRLAQVVPEINQAYAKIQKLNLQALGLSGADAEALQKNLAVMARSLREFVYFGDELLWLLGAEKPQKYLILFQNQTEIRATGGFIGSIAELTLDRGKIEKIWVPGGGSYELQGALRSAVSAPRPLQLISGLWQFHDANWFPDFPTSAKKLAWFYERSGGPTVDGVLALNASVVEALFAKIGPIAMPEYGKIITSENFLSETQKAVELEYDRKLNQPKKFIADLTPIFIEKLNEAFKQDYLGILDILTRHLKSKDLQIFFRNEQIQKLAKNFDWIGEVRTTTQGTDYLLAVNTNIGGSKSDAAIKQKISHRAEIAADGSITDTLAITRKHTAEKGEQFVGARNVDYLRVYVPEGSILLEASGFVAPREYLFDDANHLPIDPDIEKISGSFAVHQPSGTLINNEFGKTVFGNWLQTDPGSESVALLRYKLPWKLRATKPVFASSKTNNDWTSYSLLVQKQSGLITEFNSEVKLSSPRKVAASHPASWRGGGNLFAVKDRLDGDKFYSLILK